MQEQFRHPFACSHDVRRSDGLVRRNEDEPFRPMLPGRLHDDATADDIVKHRLPGILFEHGHMFVSRRMKNHLGTVFFKNGRHELFILDAAQYRPASIAVRFVVKLHLDMKKVCLVRIHQNQGLRLETNNLPAQLSPDRPPATGDQDGFTVEIAPDFPHVELHGGASQEILIIDVPQGLDADPTVNDFANSRQGLVGDLASLAGSDDTAYLIARGGRNSDQHLLDIMVFHYPGNFMQ